VRRVDDRAQLARQLVSGYASDNPDLVPIIHEPHGFQHLLAKTQHLKSTQGEPNSRITVTRAAKAQADSAAKRLAVLEAADRRLTGHRNGGMPDMIFVRASALDDPNLFSPQMVAWAARAPAWDAVAGGLPAFATAPQRD